MQNFKNLQHPASIFPPQNKTPKNPEKFLSGFFYDRKMSTYTYKIVYYSL